MHSCPECGQACYCDMEDHDTGDEGSDACEHYLSESCDPNPDIGDD